MMLRIKYFFIILFNLPEAVNRRVSVENELYRGYYAGKGLDGRLMRFYEGGTSWTSSGVADRWNHCRKVSE